MSSKNFDKYLELSKQRAKAFEKMKSNIEELRLNIQNAYISNKKESDKHTNVDIANKWAKIMVGNARQKGYNSGYAEACSHMLTFLVDLVSSVDEELKQLESLYDEILASDSEEGEEGEEGEEEDDKDSSSEDPVDPLV